MNTVRKQYIDSKDEIISIVDSFKLEFDSTYEFDKMYKFMTDFLKSLKTIKSLINQF